MLLEAAEKIIPEGEAVPGFSVEVPESLEHGDYASNIALALAKVLKKPPMEVAGLLVEQLTTYDQQLTTKIEIATPGFINFSIKDKFLFRELENVLKVPDEWGKSDEGNGKTVVVEYFQLNIAKRPHVGHLRSAVIGDAIKRMLLSQGYNAVSDTHVGDWGTQFGILLLAYKEVYGGKPMGELGDPFDVFEKLYIEENERIEKDPSRRERAKEEFAKMERGDPENREIWEWMVDVSMKKLEESAVRLNLLPFDEHRGESAYEEVMPKIVELALEKSIAKKTTDGAIVVDLIAEKLDEAVLIKSDGASTYLLRDLATIQYRKGKYDFFRNLYVVDIRQSHHFKQVFRVAELLGFGGVGESEHVEFGFMTSPEGAFSTRKGTAISLDAVLDEAHGKAFAVIKEKNPNLGNAEKVAGVVGLGALKYFDLSHHRKSDVVFRWEDALSFEGNTGPYIQYTHARLKSILRKVDGSLGPDFEVAGKPEPDELEHELLVSLLRLPEVIEDALKDFTPNTLANYLFLFAQRVNEFYHSHPVLKEPDQIKLSFRKDLVRASAITIKNALGLLGIDAPEEM